MMDLCWISHPIRFHFYGLLMSLDSAELCFFLCMIIHLSIGNLLLDRLATYFQRFSLWQMRFIVGGLFVIVGFRFFVFLLDKDWFGNLRYQQIWFIKIHGEFVYFIPNFSFCFYGLYLASSIKMLENHRYR